MKYFKKNCKNVEILEKILQQFSKILRKLHKIVCKTSRKIFWKLVQNI